VVGEESAKTFGASVISSATAKEKLENDGNQTKAITNLIRRELADFERLGEGQKKTNNIWKGTSKNPCLPARSTSHFEVRSGQ
jgi:hypothetical protein